MVHRASFPAVPLPRVLTLRSLDPILHLFPSILHCILPSTRFAVQFDFLSFHNVWTHGLFVHTTGFYALHTYYHAAAASLQFSICLLFSANCTFLLWFRYICRCVSSPARLPTTAHSPHLPAPTPALPHTATARLPWRFCPYTTTTRVPVTVGHACQHYSPFRLPTLYHSALPATLPTLPSLPTWLTFPAPPYFPSGSPCSFFGCLFQHRLNSPS